jgi:outer membrane cobalamin receptor
VASEDLPAVRVEGVRPLEEGNTPGTVTVLVPEATEGEGKTVADLLEQSAGVHVVRLRGRGGYTVALVRGGTASQTAVYVDSVLVNSASESAVDLSTLPVSSVKRIEIYRGFIPARFGVSGMGAVISLTTRKPEGPEAALLAEGESYGTYRLAGRYGNELGDGQYRLDFSLAGSRGDFSYHNDNGTPWNGADDYEATRQNNAWNEQDLLFRWENPQGWSLRAEYYAKDAELPREASGNDRPGQAPGAEQDIRTLSLSLGREGTFDGGTWWSGLDWRSQHKTYEDPLDPRTLPVPRPVHDTYDTTLLQARGGATYSLSGNQLLEFSARYARETLDVTGDAVDLWDMESSYDRNEWDLALSDTLLLSGERLRLVPLLRWNQVDGEGHLSGSLGLEWRLSETLTAKASAGKYYRAPNLYEKYGDGAYIVPRPDLKWESGFQWDLGIQWAGRMGEVRGTSSLTYFDNRADDLIEFVMVTPYVGYYDNIGESRIRGIEFESSLAWRRLDLTLSYTYTDGENLSPGARYGKPLPNRPEHTLYARLGYALSSSLDAFLETEYVGKNYFDQTGDLACDPLTTVGLGMKWRPDWGGTLTVGVRDLFDAAADQKLIPSVGAPELLWYPDPGRTFYISYLHNW